MTDPAVFAARLDAALRDGGVAAGTGRAQTLAEALTALPPDTTDALYWTARVAMLARIDDLPAFERAFRRVAPQVAAEHLDAFAAIDVAERPLAAPPRERAAPAPGERLPDGTETMDASTVWLLAAPDEHLATRDFDAFGEDERAAMLRLIAQVQVPREVRLSRRRRAARSGDRVDLPAMLRDAARTHGELVRRRYTARRERLRPLIFLLDVSGSMLPFARALLQYARVAARARPRVFAFAFATRLTDLTHRLRALDDAALTAELGDALRDYGGGTQIGAALHAFNDRYAQRGIARGGTVIILSDGWERGDPHLLASEMARLRRLAHRIVWVNPHKRHPAYEPLVAGMAAALLYVDDFVAGHNLRALDAIATLLGTTI